MDFTEFSPLFCTNSASYHSQSQTSRSSAAEDRSPPWTTHWTPALYSRSVWLVRAPAELQPSAAKSSQLGPILYRALNWAPFLFIQFHSVPSSSILLQSPSINSNRIDWINSSTFFFAAFPTALVRLTLNFAVQNHSRSIWNTPNRNSGTWQNRFSGQRVTSFDRQLWSTLMIACRRSSSRTISANFLPRIS